MSLNTVPRGATTSNPYWQHLVIDLVKNPSAGNTITIPLPSGVTVADIDGDGSVTDEISLDGVSGSNTGYRVTTGSTASSLRIVSSTGGKAGSVHVQYPIATATTPGVASATYGPITFSNGGEKTIPSGTLTVTYAAANGLQLANPARLFIDGVADTTTNAQGDLYPTTASALFAAPLPQLIRDDLGVLSANRFTDLGIAYGNGDDADDVIYSFWWSTTDTLSVVNTTTASAALAAAGGTQAMATEGATAAFAFDVSGLATGTWYFYMTSSLTGTFPLVRSRGVVVRHAPAVLSVASATGGDPDWLDSGRLLNFDNGANGLVVDARDALALTVSVVDYDDSAKVRMFYSATASLDTSVVTTTGTAPNRTITALTGASHVDSTITLTEGADSTISWRVGASAASTVTAGEYYVYAVVTDGTALAIGRSDTLYHVRHSPFLGFDTRTDAQLNTGGSQPSRYYTISWNQDYGIDGDFDRDTASGTIDLYYSDNDGFGIPDGAAALTAAAADTARDTHAITTGLSIDADGQTDNQYRWDLWTYTNPDDSGVPRAGVTYTIYGIVKTGSTRRLVRWEDGAGAARTLTFQHDPHVTIETPLSALSVDGRRSFGVSWEAADVDHAANIWVLLTPAADDVSLGTETTWSQIESGASRLWVATSTDGSLAAGQPEAENTSASTSVRPARLLLNASGAAMPITDGDYTVYVVIDDSAGSVPSADSPAFRAPGTVTLNGLGAGGAAGLSAPAIEILPAATSVAAWRDTAVFSIRPNTNGQTVDVVSVFLSVDTLYTSIVDQNSNQAGIQPFNVNSALAGQTLYDSVKAGTDSTVAGLWVMDLVYFDQAGREFDGDTDLATIKLATRSREGTARLRLDNLAPRRSAFYRNGDEVGSLAPETGAVLDLLPRATLAGQVRLQGRTIHQAEVTLQLRDRNSFTPVSDSLFVAVNDVNTTKAGLQDTLDSLGGFNLTQIPTGVWHLTAHVDRYLEGQVPAFDARPGDALTGMDPTWLRDGTTKAAHLLGGDVTGWVDTSGTSSPDNEIDQLDVDFVTTYFGATTTPTHAGLLADVDGDSLVWVPDLNMVAANFGTEGAQPSYRGAVSADALEGARVRLVSQRDDSGRLTVSVSGDALAAVRAYGMTLAYDDSQWRPTGGQLRGLFADRPALEAYRDDGAGQVHVGAALVGAGVTHVGDGPLGSVSFEAVAGARFDRNDDGIRLVAATVVGADHLPQPARWSVDALPVGFALQPAFPNPFNPETTLRVELPTAATVHLDVYDAAGQRIRTLLSQPLSAGVHAVRWDGRDARGRDVSSGAYFARLRAPGFRAERKMLLLR